MSKFNLRTLQQSLETAASVEYINESALRLPFNAKFLMPEIRSDQLKAGLLPIGKGSEMLVQLTPISSLQESTSEA